MTDMHYGGFGRRIIAFLIDNALLQVAATFVSIIGLLAVDYDVDVSGTGISSVVSSFYAAAAVMSLFYFTYFHGVTGQTVGKKILGLKVVTTTGQPLTMGIAFLRWVGYIISFLVLYLGFIWVAVDRRHQGWHDKIAGTLVIKFTPPCEEQQPDLFAKMP